MPIFTSLVLCFAHFAMKPLNWRWGFMKTHFIWPHLHRQSVLCVTVKHIWDYLGHFQIWCRSDIWSCDLILNELYIYYYINLLLSGQGRKLSKFILLKYVFIIINVYIYIYMFFFQYLSTVYLVYICDKQQITVINAASYIYMLCVCVCIYFIYK